MASSCDSQTAYSSAVRLDSVAERHWAIQLWPSCTAKRVLVLPCSMASSMRSRVLVLEEDVAGGDPAHRAFGRPKPQSAVRVQPLGDAGDGFVRQPRRAGLAEAVGARRPGVGDGREALPRPDITPALEMGGQFRKRLDRRRRNALHVLGKGG